jgi:hypothetical protein
MSVLARTNFVAQMRQDLHHLLASDSYNAFDIRSLLTALVGNRSVVLKGFDVIGKTGLSVTVNVKNAITFNPQDPNGSFYLGLPDDADIILDLPSNQQNLFIEMYFENVSQSKVNTAQWDPLALTGEDVAGSEFSSSIDSQIILKAVITVNTIGFTTGYVSLFRASTDGSNVTKMTDCRNSMWRLGSGGTNPNPSHRYPWGTKREEPVYVGTGVGDAPDSPFRAFDLSGTINDKGLFSLKDWADAVMTRFIEITGSSIWYANDTTPNVPTHTYVTGLDLPTIFLESEAGHSIQPSENVSLRWARLDPTLPINESTNPLTMFSEGVTGTDDQSAIKWQANYAGVTWEIGGSFVNDSPGGSRQYSAARLTHRGPCDNGNMYVLLERDVTPPLSSGNSVKWYDNSSYTSFDPAKTVSGVAGDFTGIAIGDWIKKASEGFSQYYKVTKLSDGTGLNDKTTVGDIADGTVVAVEMERDIATGASVEPMIYFRSRYQQSEIQVDSVVGEYNFKDVKYYWLGRRVGTTFILRGYGNMQEGEETLVKNDATTVGDCSNITLQHSYGAVYSVLAGYSLRAGGPTVLTIRKRKRDNTIYYPNTTPGDNSGASLTYTLDDAVGLMNVGDGLWVRLSDSTGGALVAGSVTIAQDDLQNTEVNPPVVPHNRWEVRSAFNNPLRTFDNKDVHLLARRIVLSNGDPALLFFDGSIINKYGCVVDQYTDFTQDVRISNDTYLTAKTPKSVLFIDQTPDIFSGKGRIDEDNASFNYDKTAQELKLFNNIFGINYLHLAIPDDQNWFTNLGNHSLYLGGGLSTVVIPGNLVVQGTQTIFASTTIASEDKNITLGIGNTLYGGGGSGLGIADNTLTPVTLQSYAGLQYVDVTYSVAPGYVYQQLVGLISNFEFDQITAADASVIYTVVTTASAPGQVQIMSPTVYRFYTSGTALAGVIQTVDSLHLYRTFDLLSEIHLSSSNSDPAFMTSWSFGVKRNPNLVQASNEGTVHAVLTPFESLPTLQDFKTIPTARNANFTRTRIPYAWEDGAGPSGTDTTFDFSNRLTWDYSLNVLFVHGVVNVKGAITTDDDNSYDIGTTAKRWNTIHVGAGGFISHNDATNTAWFKQGFTAGVATLSSDATSNIDIKVDSKAQLKLFTTGQVSLFKSSVTSGVLFQIGDISASSILADANQYGIYCSITQNGTDNEQVSIRGVVDSVATSLTSLDIDNVYLKPLASVATQIGFNIEDLTAATTNYGIKSNITSGLGKWFLYGSSATSYLQGCLGLGANNQTDLNCRLVIGTNFDTAATGGLRFGNGLSNLYRSAADTIKTDGNFIVAGSLTTNGISIVGAMNFNYGSVITSNYTILPVDCIIPIDTSASVANITINLPAVTIGQKGRMIVIKDVGGQFSKLNKMVILAANGSDKIDVTNSSITMDVDWESLTLFCDGVSGWILA